MNQASLGSQWGLWDLHFHTPSSFDYQDKSISDEQIVETLLEADVRVVAITDHHRIDVARIRNLQQLGKGSLTVLPGIELRSELGSKPIHYIGIFPEDSDLDHLWDKIRGSLSLTDSDIEAAGGDEKVYTRLTKAHETFRSLGGLISIHAGGRSNSLDEISNAEKFQQRLKFDVARDYVDILEIGNYRDLNSYNDIVFPAIGLELPLVVGSDNHNAKAYSPKIPCWIKGQPTFLGLRQAVNEPLERIQLGAQPEILDLVKEHPHRYIREVSVAKKQGAPLKERWFDGVKVALNPGLVAVIGNKGNGKSALTDIIGLLGNSRHEESFSFLQKYQFRTPKDNKARWFDATLTWWSGEPVRKNLDESVDKNAPETVRYIPQDHLERICDELRGGKEGSFEDELKSVIFSRVPPAQQRDFLTLDEIIEFRTGQSDKRIAILRSDLRNANQLVVDLERQAHPNAREALVGELEEVRRELKAHEQGKPEVVIRPTEDKVMVEATEATTTEIERLAAVTQALDEEIERTEKRIQDETAREETALRLLKALENIRRQVDGAIDEIGFDCAVLGLEPNSLVSLEIKSESVEAILSESRQARDEAREGLSETVDDGIRRRRMRAKERIVELRNTLDLPNQQYQKYQEALKIWEKKRELLLGSKTRPGTVRFLETKLDELESIPERLAKARRAQLKFALEIFEEKLRIMETYRTLYSAVQDFIDRHPLAHDRFGLQFSVGLALESFPTSFLEHIDKSRRGSYYGEADGRALVKEIVAASDFGTSTGLSTFLYRILLSLRRDLRKNDRESMAMSSQAKDSQKFYDFLFGLDYLEPRFSLKWENKPLDQLSPGERGTLLLVFFLLVDDSDTPLVIDQPEGNLDNQTVFELLVDCIKEARKRRQIIVVTHNPNLAVVCDAEQVVRATLSKEEECRVEYTSGALEDPEICQAIVDVLEGTRPAIENRVNKYRLLFDRDKATASKPSRSSSKAYGR